MAKNPMTYNERLESWQTGTCPYCGGHQLSSIKTKSGGIHYICPNKDCAAENHFSRRNVPE